VEKYDLHPTKQLAAFISGKDLWIMNSRTQKKLFEYQLKVEANKEAAFSNLCFSPSGEFLWTIHVDKTDMKVFFEKN
jgi:hypothetical protein